MTMELLATVTLIALHMINGREVSVNPKTVVRITEGRADDDPKRQMPKEVNCVIFFTDGNFLSVVETCAEVRKLMEGD